MRATLSRLAAAIGVEGAFLAVGTVLIAIAASYIHPAGPFLVVGIVAFGVGLLLSLPAREAS